MNELEQRLHLLGGELEYPPEPDVAAAVLARLDRRPFPWRTAVAIAGAVLAAAVIAAFAVPQARTTILKWFHLRGVTVERVETLPPAVERSQTPGLGRPLSRAEAERAVGFRLALPPLAHEPRRVYVVGDALASVMLRAEGRSILLSEFRASSFDQTALDSGKSVNSTRSPVSVVCSHSRIMRNWPISSIPLRIGSRSAS